MNDLLNYFHDVFVVKFDAWVVLGFIAQGFFTARFLVQWIASERARKSVVPVAFWFFSIGGGILRLVYALYRSSSPARRSDWLCTSAISISSSSTGGRRPQLTDSCTASSTRAARRSVR